MKNSFSDWLVSSWYNSHAVFWLKPFSWMYQQIVCVRFKLYQTGILKSFQVAAPVIVVGNITVGGTGKTPFVIWLVQFLKQSGFKPGVITRGYGGKAKYWPQRAESDSDPERLGDEAVLLAQHCQCPVIVGPSRAESARQLLAETDCNIIISDDGLQHYALKRDIEIAIVDGTRRLGNGRFLPAGPLREAASRLLEVDLVVCNGNEPCDNEFLMQLQGQNAVNLATNEQRPLKEFSGKACHALAGIGNPARFFDMLKIIGLNCSTHMFADHHPFQQHDINFDDSLPVLMTEKDAVKCKNFAEDRHWFVPVMAKLDENFIQHLTQCVLALKNGKQGKT